MGVALRNVIHPERGHWDQIEWDHLALYEIDENRIETIYLDALKWAGEIVRSLI